MSIRTLARGALTVAALGGLAAGAYFTRDRWVPVVFPSGAPAPAGGHDHDHDHGHGPHDHGAEPTDRVKLSPQAQENLGLDVDQLVPQDYWRTILIPGSVVDRPGESDRTVTAKVAGVVADVRARPGDTVKGGEPLFTLQLASEFLQAAQADVAKTAREIEFATARRDRIAGLVKQGTQPEAVLIEEDNQVKRLTTQLRAQRRQLQVFGLTPEQVTRAEKGDALTELTVAVPARAAGGPELFEVQELKVSLGDQVQAGQALVTLANHQKLMVEGRAFKSEAGALALAAQKKVPIAVEFADEVPGEWPTLGPLTVRHLSNQVDPATRTFGFYLELENQPRTFERDGRAHFVWRFRPGQRARLRVPVERFARPAEGGTEVLPFVVPLGAVVREGPEAFVFVQNGDVFVRKPVRVLYEDRAHVVLANDGSVTEADFVVRNQAAALNRALKATAGGGGGHHHDHDH
jgi:multidrug efflux pump subunit AcrA (membrane-fusion protein)